MIVHRAWTVPLAVIVATLMLIGSVPLSSQAGTNPTPPTEAVKLIFIHHSTGQNWLADGNGGLGQELGDNNYFVSDTNYGWGPDAIGDRTDIGNWWEWFRGPESGSYLSALYNESGQHSSYSRSSTDPGGENQVIMFKSCFPNSQLGGGVDDPVPAIADNPLKGVSCGSQYHTIANSKGIYIDLLEYFKTRQDKLFVVIVTPPVQDPGQSTNARALSQWLVDDWLDGYPYENVLVFDFYNVLTSNGGSSDTNDLGRPEGNHHRIWNGSVQHETDHGSNVLAYPSGGGDDHPSQAGNLKATAEFVPLLNDAYHRWTSSSQPVDLKLWTYQVGGDRLVLAWNEVDATGYRLQFAETGQTMHQFGEILDSGVQLATLTGLGNATMYDVMLEALQGDDVIDTANITVRTASVYVSSYQWDLEDQGNETGLLTVSFVPEGDVGAIDQYIIYRCVDGVDWVQVQTTDAPTFIDLVQTEERTKYVYRVNATVSGEEVFLQELEVNAGPDEPSGGWDPDQGLFLLLLIPIVGVGLFYIWMKRKKK